MFDYQQMGFPHHQLQCHAQALKHTFLTVWQVMFCANRFYPGLHPLIVIQRQIGEQMMLNLVVQPAVHEIDVVCPGLVVHGTDDLSQIKFTTTFPGLFKTINIICRMVGNNHQK